MKDHATFLSAMAKLPDVIGLLVGAGTEQLSVPANVRALGLSRQVERLYPAADLVVSSSAFGEGFSNVLAEGMSAGLVPIATDVGDARSIVGETGRVVAARDPDALAAAVGSEARMPEAGRQARGALARARIEKLFSIERAIDATARLYQPA